MASNLRVDTILPSTGTNVAIGTASGSVTFLGDTDISTNGDVTIGGKLGIGGTLTYEDVTNIDSVGVITARSDLSIADKIIHTGDTNTAIRFPAADTITAETGGSERLRITSTGLVGIGIAAPTSRLYVNGISSADVITARTADSNGNSVINILSEGTTGNSRILFSDTAAATGDAWISYSHNDRAFTFTTAGTSNERLRIRSDGRTQIKSGDFEVIGGEGGNAEIRLTADEGDDGADYWRFQSNASSNKLNIATYASGSWVDKITINTDGNLGINATNPNSKLLVVDDSATTTNILKLRNYKSGVNTKPRMVFEASTSAGQGGNSYISGLAGSDADGNNAQNTSGLEFIVTHGGSGTERQVMQLNSDGVIRQSAVYKQRPVDGTGANIFYRRVFGPSNIGPGNTGTYYITNGHAAGLVHLFVYRNSNSAVNRGIAYGFHLRTTGQANLGSSIYDFSGTSGAPPFTFTQGNQGVNFTNNASYTVTVSLTFELTGKVDG